MMRYTSRDKVIHLWRPSIGVSPLVASAAAGAALMYVLDPDKGARRRALARDWLVHMSAVSTKAGRSTANDVNNRARGLWHEITRSFRVERVPADILVARVWSRVGTLVSHAGAINISADEEGVVTLAGQIIADEVDDLVRECSRIPGITRVENRLETYQRSDGVPSLQGGAVRRSSLRNGQRYWSPTMRLAAGSMGALLLGYGARERRPIAMLAFTCGGALLLRSLSNTELPRFFGLTPGRRLVDVHKTFEIKQPVEEVFSFWSDFERLPQVLEHVYQVRDLGQGRLEWKMAGPAGVPISWAVEITRIVPNEMIAWRTLPHSPVAGAGVTRFERSSDKATRVDIAMSYNPPLGYLGHLTAVASGTDPKTAIDDDMTRVKSFLEAGKTTAHSRQITRGGPFAAVPEPTTLNSLSS